MKNDLVMIKDTRKRLFEMMGKVADMPIDVSEQYLPSDDEMLNEIDTENDFKDLKYTCWNIDELKKHLNFILQNYELPSHKRVKPDVIVHNKIIKKTDEGDIDVQAFIDDITPEPAQIVTKGNSKMIKSSTDDFYTLTIGLPAFRGIVYDQDNKKFLVVSTCPGASKMCKGVCYARKGNYVRLPAVYLKQTRILNLLLNNPQRFKEKLKEELKSITNEKHFRGKQMRFRWNDSGDFFTQKYFQIAKEVMGELKDEGYNVIPYAHTKVASIYNLNRIPSDFQGSLATNAPDFIVSFSTDANKKQLSQVDLKGAKTSEIGVRELFDDLFMKDDPAHYSTDEKGKLIYKDKIEGRNILKQRVSDKFGVPNDGTLLTHDEMMRTPEADKPTYNVIVEPRGETDISTQRPDVLRTFFLVH